MVDKMLSVIGNFKNVNFHVWRKRPREPTLGLMTKLLNRTIDSNGEFFELVACFRSILLAKRPLCDAILGYEKKEVQKRCEGLRKCQDEIYQSCGRDGRKRA